MFRPCIDLHGGRVKQIVGSSLRDHDPGGPITNFVASHPPAWYARLYARDGLRGGHVIMLGPGNENAAREALAAWPGGMQVGGGITVDNARDWLEAGASHVIVTSWVFQEGRLLEERLEALGRAIGRDRLVLDLSCRRRADGHYYVVTDRWQRFTDLRVEPACLEGLASWCAEFLVHGVDVEGRCAGVDEELVALLAEHSPIFATYAGGIASLDDIERIHQAGRGRLGYTVGSALDIFGGSLPYADVVALHRAHAP